MIILALEIILNVIKYHYYRYLFNEKSFKRTFYLSLTPLTMV